jgi:hypothetical protein
MIRGACGGGACRNGEHGGGGERRYASPHGAILRARPATGEKTPPSTGSAGESAPKVQQLLTLPCGQAHYAIHGCPC